MNRYVLSRRKRLLDIMCAIIGLCMLAVVALPVALAIRRTSRGPVLYRQRRLGLDGREITVTKFRTMVHDAERGTGPVLSKPGDPRITRVGRWLRRTHLDEFPQWWAVLRGHMSAVGPRPERPEIHNAVAQENPLWSIRLRVRPGITGLAQLTTNPNVFEDKLGADMMYIASASLWRDVKLLAKTARPLKSAQAVIETQEKRTGRLEIHTD